MSQFVSCLGIRVHYNLSLPKNDEPRGTIVLIHGFLSNTFTWQKCFQPLANRTVCQVLAYDRLAFGFTERVLESNRYTRKGEELLALELFKQLNIHDRIHLVSSSSGAVVAFDLAIARPDVVHSIIFVTPYGLIDGIHVPGPFGQFLLRTRPIQSLIRFVLNQFLPYKDAYFNSDLAKDPTISQGYLKPIQDDPLFIESFILFIENYDVSREENSWQKLVDSQRILIVIGENDKIVRRKQVEKFYSILKTQRSKENVVTELVTISQCGHLPQEERNEQFVDLICHFLSGNHSKP